MIESEKIRGRKIMVGVLIKRQLKKDKNCFYKKSLADWENHLMDLNMVMYDSLVLLRLMEQTYTVVLVVHEK